LLTGTRPRTVVLQIGLNDLMAYGLTPEQTANGVAACVNAIRVIQPQARILLLGILPAQVPWVSNTLIAQTNREIATLADGNTIRFQDPGASFLLPGGGVLPGVLADGAHPSPLGYALLTLSILPTLETMLWT